MRVAPQPLPIHAPHPPCPFTWLLDAAASFHAAARGSGQAGTPSLRASACTQSRTRAPLCTTPPQHQPPRTCRHLRICVSPFSARISMFLPSKGNALVEKEVQMLQCAEKTHVQVAGCQPCLSLCTYAGHISNSGTNPGRIEPPVERARRHVQPRAPDTPKPANRTQHNPQKLQNPRRQPCTVNLKALTDSSQPQHQDL